MNPHLDVIVVTYNSATVVDALLDSIPAALGGLIANVVIVDNGSSDDTLELLRKRTDCKVVQSTNVGYSAGINRGVREGSGAPAILVLNPDTRLHENAVPPLLAALSVPGTGIVVPRLLSEAGELVFSLRRAPSLLRALGLTRTKVPALSEYVHEAAAYEHPHEVEWATGAVQMMSRECFDELGGWDESFFLYSEETDLSLRARARGLATRYEPQATAMHVGGGSGRNKKTQAMQAINRVRLYGRHHGYVATWCYYWLTVAIELFWGLKGYKPSMYAAVALLRPSRRPTELHCAPQLLPSW